ncbi:uncharacterized protein V1518DRAFT_427804 [Limtongia smithiae]|uniref:uncharacterized protein n=1 Tax=Limtongia smithiae TaxID=1125753 RepID=UPI0034D00F5A
MNTNDSPCFAVGPTAYGGRGCYATRDIPAGTVVHIARSPATAVVFRDFRKEACAFCFCYDLGRSMKVRMLPPTRQSTSPSTRSSVSSPFAGAGLWFCSERCRDRWLAEEDGPAGELSTVLEAIETAVTHARKKMQQTGSSAEYDVDFVPESFDAGNDDDGYGDDDNYEDDDNAGCNSADPEDLDEIWNAMARLLDTDATRVLKNPVANPHIKLRVLALDDVEYDSARLVATAIVHRYLEDSKTQTRPEFSWNALMQLESHEADLLGRLPSLLEAHVRVFFFLRIVMPPVYLPFVTPDAVRAVLGRESANAFGIWQLPLDIESECLGSSIFPSASFFNHSCDANISKRRDGRQMVFTATRPVAAGEELNISYGMLDSTDVRARRRLLRRQWYFSCGCARCTRELHEFTAAAAASSPASETLSIASAPSAFSSPLAEEKDADSAFTKP